MAETQPASTGRNHLNRCCSRGHISPDVPLEVLEAVLHAMRFFTVIWDDDLVTVKKTLDGDGFLFKKQTGSGENHFRGGWPEGNFEVPM